MHGNNDASPTKNISAYSPGVLSGIWSVWAALSELVEEIMGFVVKAAKI